MISLEDVQAAYIASLKSDVLLVTRVGVEIREDQWQATNFVYPAVRVGLSDAFETPTGCQWNLATIISVLSTKDSSRECLQITDIVTKLLRGTTLIAATFRTNPHHISRIVPPYRADPNVWRSDIYVTALAN